MFLQYFATVDLVRPYLPTNGPTPGRIPLYDISLSPLFMAFPLEVDPRTGCKRYRRERPSITPAEEVANWNRQSVTMYGDNGCAATKVIPLAGFQFSVHQFTCGWIDTLQNKIYSFRTSFVAPSYSEIGTIQIAARLY